MGPKKGEEGDGSFLQVPTLPYQTHWHTLWTVMCSKDIQEFTSTVKLLSLFSISSPRPTVVLFCHALVKHSNRFGRPVSPLVQQLFSYSTCKDTQGGVEGENAPYEASCLRVCLLTAIFSEKVRNMSPDEIRIPPEPPGRCASKLQVDTPSSLLLVERFTA